MNVTIDIIPYSLKTKYPGLSLELTLEAINANAIAQLVGVTYPLGGALTDDLDSYLVKVDTGISIGSYFILNKADIIAASGLFDFVGTVEKLSDDEAYMRLAFASSTEGFAAPTVGRRSIDFPLDCTIRHDFRIVGQQDGVRVYVDGQLAIDAPSKFRSKTSEKVLEFGAASDCVSASAATWDHFKYTTAGPFDPSFQADVELEEVMAFRNRRVSVLGKYGNDLYISVDPEDGNASSELYKYSGGDPIRPSVVPLTKSFVSSVSVDRNVGNVFGTTAKYVGTNRGVQYVLGSKPFPFDQVTGFGSLPDEDAWSLEENCTEEDAAADGTFTTIDTSTEPGFASWKYVQASDSSVWGGADNQTGWTVETKVQVTNDGSGGVVDAEASAIAASNCGLDGDDGLSAPGILINDGTYSETVQFFQKGIRLKNAKVFADQELSSQLYTVRIVGRGNAIAVFVKGDFESSFRRLIFDPNAFSTPAVKRRDMRSPHACVDDSGDMHVVWQQADPDSFSVFYAKFVRTPVATGSMKLVSGNKITTATDLSAARVSAGFDIVLGGSKYTISKVVDRNTLLLETSDDLSKVLPASFRIMSRERTWTPSVRIAGGVFDCTSPRICVSGNSLFVAYESDEHGHQDIFARIGRINPKGTRWDDTLRVTNSHSNSMNPDIAACGPDNIVVVFESDNRIYSAVLHDANFGGGMAPLLTDMVDAAVDVRRPRIASLNGVTMLSYETRIGWVSPPTTFYVVAFKMSVSTTEATLPGSGTELSSGHATGGDASGSSLVAFTDKSGKTCFAVAWTQEFARTVGSWPTVPSDVHRSVVCIAQTDGLTDDSSTETGFVILKQQNPENPPQVDESSGCLPGMATAQDFPSRNPTLCVLGNTLVCGFESDRAREGFFEPYFFRGQIGVHSLDEIVSSNFGFIDPKIQVSSMGVSGLFMVSDGEDVGAFWEDDEDGVSIISATSSSLSENSNLGIVGFYEPTPFQVLSDRLVAAGTVPYNGVPTFQQFPFANPSCGTVNRNELRANEIRGLGGDGDILPETDLGSPLTVPAALVGKSGAVEIRILPAFASSDLSNRVFFGTPGLDLSTTTPNTLCCGMAPEISGNSIRLRVVDAGGTVHETRVPATPPSLWATNDIVTIRACWDRNAIGTARINDVVIRGTQYVPATGFGIAVGDGGAIFKTTDYGATWTKLSSGVTYDLYCVFDSADGYLWVGGEAGTILFSTDSGANWVISSVLDTDANPLSSDVRGIVFSSHVVGTGLRGYAVCGDGIVVFYNGVVWQTGVVSDQLDDWADIGVTTDGTYEQFYLLGKESLYYLRVTSPSPASWTQAVLPVSAEWTSITKGLFSGDPNVYIAGSEGTVLRSVDFGLHWADVSPTFPDGTNPTIHDIAIGAASQVWIVSDGRISRSNDSGATWSFLETRPDSSSQIAISGEKVLAAGVGGFYMYSSNGAVVQDFSTMSSGNLALLINGIEPTQVRTNDYPFDWSPTDLKFADYNSGAGLDMLQAAVFAEPPPRGSALDRHSIRAVKVAAKPFGGLEDSQRIEWGNISPYAKGVSVWKEFKMFVCGAREPVKVFCFDSRIGLSDDTVNSLSIGSDGTLWAATNGGISSISTSKITDAVDRWLSGLPERADDGFVVTYSPLSGDLTTDPVIAISASKMGVFAASASRLYELQKPPAVTGDPASQQNVVAPVVDNGSFVSLGDSSARINTIRATDDILYVGTSNGLFIVNSDGTSSFLGVLNGLPDSDVRGVDRDSSGAVWLGTGAGLTKLSKNVITFGQKNGLIGNDIRSVFVDGAGNVVMGTNFGISVFDGKNFRIVPPSSIGDAAPFQGDYDAAGDYWFSSSTGLLELDNECLKYSTIDSSDGLLADASVPDFQFYNLADPGLDSLSVGCNEPVAFVTVNGQDFADGFKVDYANKRLRFDHPRNPSDIVGVEIHTGLRRIRLFKDEAARIETDRSSYDLYRKSFPAGDVSLGGPAALGLDADSVRNYSVMVVPITGTVDVEIESPDGYVVFTESKPTDLFYVDESDIIKSLPAEVSGSRRIVTAAADSEDVSDEFIEFSISAASRVYVAFDSSVRDIPDWLRGFEKVSAVSRISAMQTFTDASGNEQLFVGSGGSNGCVNAVLDDPTICDISATTALDAEAPTGCATVSALNSPSNFTLSISATDGVTGVAEMQISPNEDFTDDGSAQSAWVPYQSVYNYEFPAGAVSSTADSASLDSGTGSCLASFRGKTYIGTSSPALVYEYDAAAETVSVVLDLGEDEVSCMMEFGGDLIIGTGSSGKVFSWDGIKATILDSTVGDKITALGSYDGDLYVGGDNGEIWIVSGGDMRLFRSTLETAVNGFATFGTLLYWATENSNVSNGDILPTTVKDNHRHTFTVTADGTLAGLNGTTSEANGHTHAVVDGVVQPAEGHVHALNGSASGKIYSYDKGTGQIKIVHADQDYAITAIGSIPTGLFAGTYPHGKVLRQSGDVFVKSFQTPDNRVNRLVPVGLFLAALVDNDAYVFDTAWTFKATVSDVAHDILPDSTAGEYLILKDSALARTATAPAKATQLCAFVRFRDFAGNVTQTDSDPCYNPCISTKPPDGTPGSLSNRLFEIDATGKVVLSLNGSSQFFAGNKVEKEEAAYYSEVFNGTSALVRWESIGWDATTPDGTEITVSVRVADTSASIPDAVFGEELTDSAPNDITSLQGQFLQFRATLSSTVSGSPSPTLNSVTIKLRTSQATHFYTTNFKLPDKLAKAILTYNGCINPPSTDLIFGITGQDSTDFGDYYVIPVNKAFDFPPEHRTGNLRVGIKFISSPTEVPVVDEFGILLSLANDAKIKLNLPGTPTETAASTTFGSTRTVLTDKVQNHSHSVSFDSSIADQAAINVVTSTNAGHFHQVVNGEVQPAAGHKHDFSI